MKKAIEFDEVYVAQRMRAALTAFAPLKDCMLENPDKEDWYRAGKAETLACAANAAFPAISHLGLSFPVVRIAPLGLLFALVDRLVGNPLEKYQGVWSELNREQRLAVADSWLDWLTRWERPQQVLSWSPRWCDGFILQQVLDGVAYVAPWGMNVFKGEIVWLRGQGGKWSRSPFNHAEEEPRWLAGIINKLNEEIGV